MNLVAEKLVHFRSRSQIRWRLTIYMSEQYSIRGERQGRGSTLQDPRAVRLELPPAPPVFCLNQRRRVLSTSLLHTIKRESKRPLVHRGTTATIARHGVLHFTSLPPPKDSSSIPPANFRSNLLGRRLNDIVSFLLGRNGYLNLSIFRRLGVLAF